MLITSDKLFSQHLFNSQILETIESLKKRIEALENELKELKCRE